MGSHRLQTAAAMLFLTLLVAFASGTPIGIEPFRADRAA